MVPSANQLAIIAGSSKNLANINSVVVALQRFGAGFGLDKPHRLAWYLGQLGHESGAFKYDREIASGEAYEGRTDLGNTQPGDGVRFKGRGPLQITGRANYTAFRDWCRAQGFNPPDFVANPEAINTDPWEGLGPIWYWSTRKLNKLADENNGEQLTKKINGGLNGFADRLRFYVRSALVLLDYGPTDVEAFQRVAGIAVDGDPGPKTRSALHMALVNLDATGAAAVVATPAPVVSEVVVDVKAPGKGGADATTGAGVATGGLAVTVSTLQEQLTPFSMAGGWITRLVVGLAILSAILTVGGLAWRFWAMRKKAKKLEELNA